MKIAFRGLLVALGALLALPASGDWLVTRDGAKVETKGPWKVKGGTVVFTLPSGTLSSLRLAEIDLDASSLATAEARRPQQTPKMQPPTSRKSAVVLTDKDIPRAAPLPAPPATPEAAAESVEDTEERPAADQPKLEIASWKQVDNADIDGLEIVGEIQNAGQDLAFGVGVVVTLLDEDGSQIASADGFVTEKSLAPRTRAGFRALFPGVNEFAAEPDFKLVAENIRISLPGGDGAAQSADGEDDPDQQDPSEGAANNG